MAKMAGKNVLEISVELPCQISTKSDLPLTKFYYASVWLKIEVV
jgi:hypothetical protein